MRQVTLEKVVENICECSADVINVDKYWKEKWCKNIDLGILIANLLIDNKFEINCKDSGILVG